MVKARDELEKEIKFLKQEVQKETESLESEKEEMCSLKEQILPRAMQLREGEIQLLAEQKRLEAEKIQKNEKMIQHKNTMFYLQRDVLDLISQLAKIFNITKVNDNQWSICGHVLPNSDFINCNEEIISIALGHVCHLTFLLSKYLDVPLRYFVVPKCSTSTISDDITNKGQYPLFSEGVDRTRFEYAVFLLNKNIEQLLNSQKLEAKNLRETLPNLHHLLSHLENLKSEMLSSTSKQNTSTQPSTTSELQSSSVNGTSDNRDSSGLIKADIPVFQFYVNHLNAASQDPETARITLAQIGISPSKVVFPTSKNGALLPYFIIEFNLQSEAERFKGMDSKKTIGGVVLRIFTEPPTPEEEAIPPSS
eukprot:TRINITY_DN4713_c0_g1_i1.p1 TRINITY_DN4713_c0_g1~~TRINITY_DN4713_c0_g1_i1.p1  ORF type:complete len:365 (-),score=56.07 TRINITY_DN4713_c0_g1_i1:82-1176(-)